MEPALHRWTDDIEVTMGQFRPVGTMFYSSFSSQDLCLETKTTTKFLTSGPLPVVLPRPETLVLIPQDLVSRPQDWFEDVGYDAFSRFSDWTRHVNNNIVMAGCMNLIRNCDFADLACGLRVSKPRYIVFIALSYIVLY